ncbi:MAG: acyl-ACP--UDP-N-acetylglucosamine O-acyltransferase [Acidobacteriia bacterium]|nr:acyl-ACP--UDP-N-acetylglucosamine O-acyltransferase [Terriglobia bacterium]
MASPEVHRTAVVDPSARIGAGAAVGPYCVVETGVEIGAGTRLLSHVVVHEGTALGPDNVVFPMAVLGGAPQDLKYRGEPTRLVVGARNRIREFVTLNRGTDGGGGITTVGDDNLVMAYSHVAHDCRVGNGTILGNAATLAGHVVIGDEASVGAFSGIHQFTRVARHAFIGGYSVVTQDALPWVLTVGNRATTHGINLVGLKRKGYGEETIEAIKQCYLTLFRSKLLLKEAMEKVESELGHHEEVRYFLEFVRTSTRGVCR